jgi:hypothetical protein
MGLDAHGNRAVGGRVAERIRDEVEEHTLNLIGGAPGGRILVDAGLEPDPARSRLGPESAQARVNETRELCLA